VSATQRNGSGPVTHADAVVIGAGPGGSAAATFLADAGHDVVLIEKEAFPRDKVCGDGLTPRAVKALKSLGLHEEAEGRPPGWDRQSGLRMYGGGVVLDLPWPELDDWPAHSVTATRELFDSTLARNAAKRGATLWESTEVTAPVYLTQSENRVSGVAYQRVDADGEITETGTVRAPIVIAADGGSSRFAVQLGLHRNDKRPMGVAVRTYYRSPRSTMGMMEGFLDLFRQTPDGGRELLPGYGWIFPLDGGLVNVGWGLLNTSEAFRSTNYRKTLDEWVAGFPAEWEMSPDTRVGKPRSAGLPMGHNRKPLVHKGVLLVGDAGGMVNPFNGEGISYAIEAAAMAAEAADAAVRARSDAALHAYARAVADEWGGYYTLGRWFVALIGQPAVMKFCTEVGMPRRKLMEFVFRLMAHLTDRRSADLTDLVVNTLSRAVPAA
jgi:menaquinone-9 beta-reductase